MALSKAEEEVKKFKELETRIKAPSIWARLVWGIRIEDLQQKRFDEALRFVKLHYLNEEVTFKALNILDDPESTAEYMTNFRIWIKDKMSLAAIKEGTEKLVGLIVMRLQEEDACSRTFSRIKLTHTSIYSEIMKFYNEVEKGVNIFYELSVPKYLKIYLVAIKPRYRHRGVVQDILKAAIDMAKTMNIPAIAGLFPARRCQEIAEKMGFVKFKELYYVRYLINDKVIFLDTGSGNFGCAVMGYRIPDMQNEGATEVTSSEGSFYEGEGEAGGEAGEVLPPQENVE